MKKLIILFLVILSLFVSVACADNKESNNTSNYAFQNEVNEVDTISQIVLNDNNNILTVDTINSQESTELNATIATIKTPYLIVIDPGHQLRGNNALEPLGPGSTEMKARVTGGTSGCVTRISEYELNLQVSLKLKTELESRGYQVLMTRTTNNVDISNMERAIFANEAKADVFIRIHANGSENSSIHGVMTICQTPSNPYNASFYNASKALSVSIINGFVEATGANKQSIWETDTMTGINWAQVPSTIVEMGYMSNPNEDTLMSTDEYQNKMVAGIANGIDSYFEQ